MYWCTDVEYACCTLAIQQTYIAYIYRSVHHLDSWIKIDQLDVSSFFISLFNAQHVSDVSTSILRSLRLICWVISWVVLLCKENRWTDQQCFSLHPDTTPHQPNHNVTPTRIVPGMCKFIHKTSEYIQETSSKNILHTKKTR